MERPVVAIVGRPNVGKSTLFNRLLQRRRSIEDDRPGITRDRISEDMEWNGKPFTLVDTGGLLNRTDQEMDRLVSLAAEESIREADIVVFVADGRVSPTDTDIQIARMVLRIETPVVLAVTKIDNIEKAPYVSEFYSLGLGDPIPVSGISGLNTGDLLDKVVEEFPEGELEKRTDLINLAIIGRPNVGKSSLVNRLIGEDRQIVSDIPGTTRDPVDFDIKYKGKVIRLIDTAGIRRKKEVNRASIDYYTTLRTIKALNRCDVAAVLLDASEGLTQYDRRLLDEVRAKGKGLIAIYNKWDKVDKDSQTTGEFFKEFRFQLPDLSFAPLVFMSALTGKRARQILEKAYMVDAERSKRITTARINEFIQALVERKPPPAYKGKWLRIKYASQVASRPPVFAVFLNYPEYMADAYKKFIERSLREEYNFEGVPLKVVFRKK